MSKAKFPIRYYGHPDLRAKAKPIEILTSKVLQICEEMVEMMLSLDNCIGFAGPQLGVLLRVFVIREEKFLPNDEYYFGPPEVILNPTISRPSKETVTMQEGCMSLPGLHVTVTRPKSVHVRYQNMKGEWVEENPTEFRARMFMHENDHLNGVLHIDRMDPKERKELEPVLRAMKQKYNS